MTRFFPFIRLSLFLAGSLLLISPAWADTVYSALINGQTSGTDSPAFGTAILTLNAAETEVFYEVEYSGLQGNEIGAHFHNAAPGMDGPRLLLLFPGSPKTGFWEVEPFEVEELAAGRVYINVHTDAYPMGEIRGNLEFSSVPNDAASWGSIKALFH